ncbi:hypothetical protein HMPREF0083_03861 [Aneurinibacillus aneurinilyticus ATCC 12856]|uniref:Uncharacterized protein n=1 Tax=Aneurinibacillus aneurinilyticus ATCC 12856 TaxID=649747 RepID=U1X0K5_ANEAE|nr:hypothetical protein HMPREF0083_03861 [Aneurinibacillus aneurinilyticus ATCC 12856]
MLFASFFLFMALVFFFLITINAIVKRDRNIPLYIFLTTILSGLFFYFSIDIFAK